MKKIKLNKQEVAIGTWIGNERQSIAERRNLNNLNQCGKNDNFLHINGALGELAFSKLFCVYPESMLDELGNKMTYDVWVNDLGGVDIKTTSNLKGSLNVEFHKRDYPADYYALMMGNNDTFFYAGIIHKDEVFKEENLKNVGNGDFYSVQTEYLN
mgnify:CR=1 FL=1